MKQERINKAYISLVKLREYNLPVKKAYAIYKMLSVVEGAYEFAFGEEKKYLDEFGGTIKNGVEIVFETPEKCAMFKTKINELYEAEVDIEIEPVTLTEGDLKEQTLTPADIANLDGFVVFE